MELSTGILLLSDPFLKDPHFARTAVLVCEHNELGSFGLVLNRKTKHSLGELVQEAKGIEFPIFDGGPVDQHTLHFLHRSPKHISEGIEVADGIFWGGDFAEVVKAIKEGLLTEKDIRFFVGYSGWSEGQLAAEYESKSWIIAPPNPEIIFQQPELHIWKKTMHTLGGEYALMSNYPSDPQLN
jgi:putative transcriptional regulator